MKKWWIGYTGVGETVLKVDVATETNVGTGWERSHFRLPSGVLEDAPSKDLFATEAEARRARVLSEAEDLEAEAKNYDIAGEHCRDRAASELEKADWYKAEAAAFRARAKGLRDALEEVRDATEGRR